MNQEIILETKYYYMTFYEIKKLLKTHVNLDLVDSYLLTIRTFLSEIKELKEGSNKYIETINIAKMNLQVYREYLKSVLRPNV